jgi:hypothetical protein
MTQQQLSGNTYVVLLASVQAKVSSLRQATNRFSNRASAMPLHVCR